MKAGPFEFPISPTPDLHREWRRALDSVCSAAGFMDFGDGKLLHNGRFYPHPVDCGHRRSVDHGDSGSKNSRVT